jgi:hypothetical protein
MHSGASVYTNYSNIMILKLLSMYLSYASIISQNNRNVAPKMLLMDIGGKRLCYCEAKPLKKRIHRTIQKFKY